MKKDVEAFLARVANEPELEARLKAAKSLEEVAAVVRAEGFDAADLADVTAALGDQELEAISGGKRLSNEELARQLAELTRVRGQAAGNSVG
jgi:predicted ribosomally synthesized peptide with nif11-like leader